MDPDTETFGPVSSDPNVKRILENDAFETFHIDRNDQLWATHVDGGMIRINLLTGNVRRIAFTRVSGATQSGIILPQYR